MLAPQRTRPTKPEMKAVDRVLSVLRLEEPDRVPHFEWEFSAEVIEALSGSRDYFNFIELMDIDAVMVAPRYRTKKIGADLLIDVWGATRRWGVEDSALPVDDLAPIKTMYGPSEQVVEAVKRCIREAGVGGGYVCSSSNSIHSRVDPQLYKVMVEAIHHYGRYPLDMDLLAPMISE